MLLQVRTAPVPRANPDFFEPAPGIHPILGFRAIAPEENQGRRSRKQSGLILLTIPSHGHHELRFDTTPVHTYLVRIMKNITFSADEDLVERARDIARRRKSTLNQLFREWLADLAGQQERENRLRDLDLRLDYAQSGGKFTREEMNAR